MEFTINLKDEAIFIFPKSKSTGKSYRVKDNSFWEWNKEGERGFKFLEVAPKSFVDWNTNKKES